MALNHARLPVPPLALVKEVRSFRRHPGSMAV
jgi:hypothetical protein